MQFEKYEEISEGIDKAQESTTPFLINDEELMVAGDANRIEQNKYDFEIYFRAPIEEDGKMKYVRTKKEYKGVFLSPMVESRVENLMVRILPYYRKPNDDGTVTKYTPEEAKEIADRFDKELTEIMYETVGVVLGIDKELIPFMEKPSVLDAVAKIIYQYPEMVNASETFFE